MPRIDDHDFILHIATDTPPIEVDPVHIGEIVANLVDNAAKYAPRDSPIEVAVTAVHGPQPSVHLLVTDRGRAIPPEQRTKVFNKFYRVPGTVPQTPGTGMGLAIVKGLVEANGGSVTLEDAQPGNRFVVAFPTGETRELASPESRLASPAQR